MAVVDFAGSHTFSELDRASAAFASWLKSSGLGKGDRVVLLMENSAALVAAVFGVIRAGGVVVVLSPSTKSDKLRFVLNDCSARHVVAAERLSREVEPVLRDAGSVTGVVWIGNDPMDSGSARTARVPGARWDDILADPANPSGADRADLIDADLAAIIYTSGSTGVPKGVMLTHRNVCHSSWSIATYLGLTEDDVVVNAMPLAFGYGLFQVFMSSWIGFAVLLERSFAYPFDVLQRIAGQHVTVLPGVPSTFSTILSMAPYDDLDLSSVRILTNAAAALAPAHIRRLTELFPHAQIFSMYGLTECTRVCYLDPALLLDRIGSVGKAMPNTEAYLVDTDGRRVPYGGTGELVVRGASVMRGYWARPDETAKCLREGEIQGERVLYTGDQFRTDQDGFLYFVGRSDDIFKCKGQKVSPTEVESAIYEMEDVAEVAVVGVPDEADGAAVKAIVVCRPNADIEESAVRRHCRARLESFMVPKFVEFRDSLPKTESGKIRRKSV